MPKRPRVVVAGGSLGGLAAALHLRDAGCDVTVYERSRTPLQARGAGIVLHPATVRRLGSGDINVNDVSTQADTLRYVARDGSLLHEEPCRYRFTSYYTLYQGFLDRLDDTPYHLGREVMRFEQEGPEAAVYLHDGTRVEADLVVFADGIHSTGRAQALPEAASRYAGYVGWRGTMPASELDDEDFQALHRTITYHVGRDTHVLTYPIPGLDGSVEPERRRINFVWYRNVPSGEELDDLMTDREGVRRAVSLGPGAVQERHVQALFDEAVETLPPAIARTVTGSKEPFVQVVFDVDVERMAFGRVCLIGDAAFVVRPHAAVGTAKAADDALRLAEAMVATRGDVPATLRRWEPGQLEVGRRVLARARDLGERSQFLGTYRPPDRYLAFGLYEPGDSEM